MTSSPDANHKEQTSQGCLVITGYSGSLRSIEDHMRASPNVADVKISRSGAQFRVVLTLNITKPDELVLYELADSIPGFVADYQGTLRADELTVIVVMSKQRRQRLIGRRRRPRRPNSFGTYRPDFPSAPVTKPTPTYPKPAIGMGRNLPGSAGLENPTQAKKPPDPGIVEEPVLQDLVKGLNNLISKLSLVAGVLALLITKLIGSVFGSSQSSDKRD